MQNGLPPNGLEVRREGGLLGPGTLAQDVLGAGRRDSERKKGCCHRNGLPDWWVLLFSALGSALGWEGAVLAQVKGTSVKMRSNHNCRRSPPGNAASGKELPSHHRPGTVLL